MNNSANLNGDGTCSKRAGPSIPPRGLGGGILSFFALGSSSSASSISAGTMSSGVLRRSSGVTGGSIGSLPTPPIALPPFFDSVSSSAVSVQRSVPRGIAIVLGVLVSLLA